MSFVYLVLVILTNEGKLNADMQVFPSCPEEKVLRTSLEEAKAKGAFKDYWIQCSIAVTPVKRSEAEDQNRL